jgi:PKD repeat protein
MPYAAIAGCASGQSPNGNPADSVLNNIAHEQNESMSDPLGNGWYDNTGAEIADKCHLTFGASRGATATGQYNQVINGHGYWLQQLWSNRAGGCVQRNTFPVPVATVTHKPTLGVHGKKVTFRATVHEAGESKFSYRWTFPDGGTSTARNPVHVFAGALFAGMVTLIVTDSHGSQTRAVNTITVA